MRIDAHQHYWQISRGDYGWLTSEKAVLYRDYLPADLEPLLEQHGFDASVVVQAAPTVDETKFLLDLADRHPSIAGVVGWLDFEAEDFTEQLTELRGRPKFVGLRPMIQDIPDVGWMLRPDVIRSFQILAALQFPVDILVRPHHLPHLLQLLRRVPGLHAVIDHAAKPDIRHHTLSPWGEQMRAIAAHSHVFCKLSGLVTEAFPEAHTSDGLRPYVGHLLDVFGPQRVLFGSDWPVCLEACSYGSVMSLLQGALPPARLGIYDGLFGDNAMTFYGLAPDG